MRLRLSTAASAIAIAMVLAAPTEARPRYQQQQSQGYDPFSSSSYNFGHLAAYSGGPKSSVFNAKPTQGVFGTHIAKVHRKAAVKVARVKPVKAQRVAHKPAAPAPAKPKRETPVVTITRRFPAAPVERTPRVAAVQTTGRGPWHGSQFTDARPSQCYGIAWCGCWLAAKLGLPRNFHGLNLYMANDWTRVGSPSAPGPNVIAVWPHRHVGIIRQVNGDGTAMIESGNYGNQHHAVLARVRLAGLVFRRM